MKAKVRTVARSVKKHRVFFLFVMGLFTIGLLAGSYAIQTDANIGGQTQAGDHQWWDGFKAGDVGGNQAFCENCHTAIKTDIAAGQHDSASKSQCSYCHSKGAGDHAAAAAQCTDCHNDSVKTSLNSPTEAHNGIYASLGEDSGVSPETLGASQTCQSCHTHAEVAMTITADPPIPLQMGGP